MYKNIEVLNKSNHSKLSLDKLEGYKASAPSKYIPLGISEVTRLSSKFPVVIGGTEDSLHFTAVLGLGNQENFFANGINFEDRRFVPMFMRTYPFVMVNAKVEGSDKVSRVVAFDKDAKELGDKKEFPLFDKKGEMTDVLSQRVELLKMFDQDRFRADAFVQELKDKDLLTKRSIKMKLEEGKDAAPLLTDFYVVDRKKLTELDDATIANWSKRGYWSLIEAHIKSIENIDLHIANAIKTAEPK